MVKRVLSHEAKHFFSGRVVYVWNSLPCDVVDSTTVTSFKNRFAKYFESNQQLRYYSVIMKFLRILVSLSVFIARLAVAVMVVLSSLLHNFHAVFPCCCMFFISFPVSFGWRDGGGRESLRLCYSSSSTFD